MRVIAGKYKGRQLKSVQGKSTRPTGDKIKEAVFHKMGPFFEGGLVLDLFAGSGSLGIEALSRGADKAIFIDQSKQAIRTIHDNISLLKIKDSCEVYQNDAGRAIEIISKKTLKCSLILLDPPYMIGYYPKLINQIAEKQLMEKNGYLYIEHQPGDSFQYPDGFIPIFEKKYNETTSVTILQYT